MNKEAETYDELIRKKRCIDLTKYYDLSQEDLEQIYTFLEENQNGVVRGNSNSTLLLIINNDIKNAIIINAKCIEKSIDGIILDNKRFTIIPHYTPSSSSGHSGGSSSNNNNNNNNNNR